MSQAVKRPTRARPGERQRHRRLIERLLGIAALAGAYFVAAHVGYALNVAGPVAAIIWLPAGVGIAFLTLGGPGLWPGVLVGDLLVNDYGALPLGSALGQTAGNVLEAIVAALLIRRLTARQPPLATVAGLGRLLVSLAAGVAVSATVGVLAQILGGVISGGAAGAVWHTWWLGDMAGAVVIVPFALAWRHSPPRAWWPSRAPEVLVVVVLVAGVAELVFSSRQPLAWLTFPGLIWSALRFREWGATLAIASMAAICTWNTAHFVGPFAFESITHTVISAQLFIVAPACTTLALAAIVAERESFAAGLSASRARLVDAAGLERARLERNLHDGAQQRLTAIGAQLRLARDAVRRDPASADSSMHEAELQLGMAVDELRELARGLHPGILMEQGLPGAVAAIAARSDVRVVIAELPIGRLDRTAEATAYYVISEAVANAQKHAQASTIRIGGRLAGGRLRLEIRDDGRGGAVDVPRAGLEGLRDRVEAIGGVFGIDSRPGAGTRVVAVLPAAPRESDPGPTGGTG
jgi:signal transduction histidine kinase